jgi:hypothetical protein
MLPLLTALAALAPADLPASAPAREPAAPALSGVWQGTWDRGGGPLLLVTLRGGRLLVNGIDLYPCRLEARPGGEAVVTLSWEVVRGTWRLEDGRLRVRFAGESWDLERLGPGG